MVYGLAGFLALHLSHATPTRFALVSLSLLFARNAQKITSVLQANFPLETLPMPLDFWSLVCLLSSMDLFTIRVLKLIKIQLYSKIMATMKLL